MSLSQRNKAGLTVKSKIVKSTAIATTVGVIVFGILFGPKVYETSKKQVIQTKNKITYAVKDRVSSFQNSAKKETLKVEKEDLQTKEQPSKAAYFEQSSNEIVVDSALLTQSTKNENETNAFSPKELLGLLHINKTPKSFKLDSQKEKDNKSEANSQLIETISDSEFVEEDVDKLPEKNMDDLSRNETQPPSAKTQTDLYNLFHSLISPDSELESHSENSSEIELEPLSEDSTEIELKTLPKNLPEIKLESFFEDSPEIELEPLAEKEEEALLYQDKDTVSEDLSDNADSEKDKIIYYDYGFGQNVPISKTSALAVGARLFGLGDTIRTDAFVGAEVGVDYIKFKDNNAAFEFNAGIGAINSNILTARVNYLRAFNDKVEFSAGVNALHDFNNNNTILGGNVLFRIGIGGALSSSSNFNRSMQEKLDRFAFDYYQRMLFENKYPQKDNPNQENNNQDNLKPSIIGPVDDGRGMQF